MEFFIFVLIICLLLFLFALFLLANDDFVLLRQNVSMENIFDKALVVALSSWLGARILYIVLNPDPIFFNPLVFFWFPYFPGLSLTGAVVGALLAVPKGRILDFFSISFLSTLPIGFLGFLLLSLADNEVKHSHIIGLIVTYIILFIAILKFALPLLLSGKLKDGSIGLIFLVSFSIISLIENAIDRGGKNLFNGGIEDFTLVLILLIFAVFLFRQEKILSKVKKYWEAKKT